MKVVYRLLLLNRGPLVKFSMEVYELDSCPDIDNRINFLSNPEIQEFTLSHAKTDLYELPSHLFTFQHLRHLKLRHSLLRPSDGFKGFSNLISLELEEVIMDAKTIEWLVSSFPLLEQFFVSSYTANCSIEIRAPNLIVFSFTGEFASASFKNTLFLIEVAFSLCSVNKYSKHSPLMWPNFFVLYLLSRSCNWRVTFWSYKYHNGIYSIHFLVALSMVLTSCFLFLV